MKIVNIIGGLGNQMFQYAFAIGLQTAYPDEEIKLNISSFRGYPLHNGFELDSIFKIRLPYATTKELCKVAYPWIHYRLWQIGTRIFPIRKCMAWDKDYSLEFDFAKVRHKSYFDGYWQSPKFFEKYKPEIVEAFKFQDFNDPENLDAIRFIKSGKTAFIHIRRGDYINNPLFKGICDKRYYHDGLDMLINKYKYNHILIFSNDIKWCKSNLAGLLENISHKYVDWNKGKNSYKDMQLMSKCQGALIANSSFSWWGAWLGDMDIVIAPKRWTNDQTLNTEIIPDKWLKI